jgi:hypothetical protein
LLTAIPTSHYCGISNLSSVALSAQEMEQCLGGCQFHHNVEVEMVDHEWLCMQQCDFCCNGIFKLTPEWMGIVLKNNDTQVE